jgi:hypothetical protein
MPVVFNNMLLSLQDIPDDSSQRSHRLNFLMVLETSQPMFGRFRPPVAVPDKYGRRAQADPPADIIKHLLKLLAGDTDILSPSGRIRIIEGHIILCGVRNHNPMRDVQLVHHPHVYQCNRYKPRIQSAGEPFYGQSPILDSQAAMQCALPVFGNPENG